MEKRQHDRLALKDNGWQAELIDQVSGNKLGEVVNLSPAGMMLITSTPVDIANLYQVECVTIGPDGQVSQFTAGIIILWITQASQSDTYWVGTQIIDIDAASQARLRVLGAAVVSDI